MTVTDTTAPAQNEALAFQFDLPHGAEKIWRALTDPALLKEWLLPVFDFAPTPGTSFTFQTDPVGGWDGIVHAKVATVELHRRLSYHWDVGDMATVVTFTLTPTPTGTRMLLIHSGFREDQKKNWGGARYGWKMMGAKLVDLLGRTA